MIRRNNKNPKATGHRGNDNLARQVRSIITSLTIPSILTACAPLPHANQTAGNSTGPSGRTVLYVMKSRSKGEASREAGNDGPVEGAREPRTPANQYIPLPSDIPIFENILSKYRIQSEKQKLKQPVKNQPDEFAVTMAKPRPSRVNNPRPAIAIRSAKDGLWERVRKRLMLTAFEHETVLAEVEKIRHAPGALNYLSRRAEPFLFYIVDEIERRGLPMDLAMVPMVESAFEPAAVSPKQAAGIWQIIPGTATDYGLKLVDGYDGRYDIYASTKAALKYLSRLQGLFAGDWLLALAAYNAGEGAVQKAIQANQKDGLGTSFWELNLPAETKAYVPKILALSRVIADPGAYGVSLRKISSVPYLARVEVNSPAALGQAVAGAGMSWEEFAGMNPAFKPDVAPAVPFNLLLPLDKAELLVANLQGSRLIAARKYVVKKGETLTVIARQQGVPPLKLAEWNGLKADSRVKPGQELIIYPV